MPALTFLCYFWVGVKFLQVISEHPNLSIDPRIWTKWDVLEWLKWATERYSIREVTADKFLMNGKGMCMLGFQGFLYRVPRGGDVLFSDFQKRVNAAVEQSRHLQSYLNGGPSNFYYVY